MKILNESSFLSENGIALIEEKYKAKYVLETCLRNRVGGWANFPAAVFYTEEKHPEGSNYFAIYYDDGNMRITNALSSIQDVVFSGLQSEDKVVYSRYRHDFRRAPHNDVFVDGGRDYFRAGGDDLNVCRRVDFKVEKDQLVIVP